MIDIAPGVYRLTQEGRLIICNSENFTVRGPGVELITEEAGFHARVLDNTNLSFEGTSWWALQSGSLLSADFPRAQALQMLPSSWTQRSWGSPRGGSWLLTETPARLICS